VVLSNQASTERVDDIGLHLLDPENFPIVTPTPVTAYPISVELLNAYSGQYRLDPDSTIEVTTQQNKLYITLENQARYEFQALSDNEFTAPALGVTIGFQRDASGKITGFIWEQNGTNMTASRVN